MIDFKRVNKYCKDDLYLIENYEYAIKSPESWDCHHRLEIDLNLSRKELKDRDLYFNRPASELIFLTRAEHVRIHKTGENNPMYGKSPKDRMSPEAYEQWRENFKGENNPMYGKNIKDFMTSEAYEQWREKFKGENHPMYGRTGENHPMYGKPSAIRGMHRVYHEDGSYHYEK